ncbi:hypothetical protein D7Z54_20230 [Salibacterium salarium]|uniref:Uncharacterized protein n=1 Tax=Salibacterium salarium TaxID=284579 RepID=A0A428MZM6_9BACI|nr:hypothetical protein [Salibacterium salarium]RSL31567.1 hypothetical protein D7Z54_20230 [Salibacterium salarium]
MLIIKLNKKKCLIAALLLISIGSIVFNIFQQVHTIQLTNQIDHSQDNDLAITNYLARIDIKDETINSLERLENQIDENDIEESTVQTAREDFNQWSYWATHFVLSLQYKNADNPVHWYWDPQIQTVYLNQKQNELYRKVLDVKEAGDYLIKQAANDMDTVAIRELHDALVYFNDTLFFNEDGVIHPDEVQKDNILQSFEDAISKLDELSHEQPTQN